MTRLTDHLIVISFDCLSALDFHILEELPNFQELLNKGSYCKHVETIYPSVTYPCHATIVTGKFPNRHGVINNTFLQPGNPSPDWYWHRFHIKGTTLYDEAKKAGLKTAALLWPVTAKANIDYNMPEIFSNRPWLNQIAVSLANGSVFYQIDMNNRFGHIRKGLSQPELDDFVIESAVHTIETKKPNLMLVHFTDLDTQRHYHGFSSDEAHAALKRHDMRLGRILHALKDAGIYENSTIVVLGDHSALDESKAVKINVLLREQGLINVNENGKVTNWKAYCKSCDGSAYIYLHDQKDIETKTRIGKLLQDLQKDENNGIEFVITGEEAGKRGADEKAAFMIEARRGFYFHERLEGAFIDSITKEDVEARRYTVASHGYSPTKENYETVIIAAGKGIRENVAIPSMHLIDEGPTFAKLLGVNLGDTDGKVINEMLNV
ncbi:alkaline phosphatase family protein [Lederbergia wuyishanensis]|uniref:AlkP superfamily pyrophosphatase or phosphodiesterase n=1 Tax=Lederbergia wuyishanensis TaxID=1347903 RepID=A0ABU0D8B7_9BACI|nr:ectonucleotide pyrophosphatase/phosphodiesterase [Lederbergia wuyishanensis]MCJ8009223.1 ectonucleotide pyrophosphatase/phosphodiesterase [Lederbergia wuyishanensis]MDQ0344647.1 putative AlkP superfamily pyrophosphatase or phosphodiesterase [Lederbergia wuyishanensis]